MPFSRHGLEQAGFVGWAPFDALRQESPCPRSGGIYVVYRDDPGAPTYADTNCGGWFKGQDPSVSRDALVANWVDGAHVIYIGKANDIRRRLKQYADFGSGKPVGHWGGRLIWQLADLSSCFVAWKETPDCLPAQAESDLISLFRAHYGKPPFANEPHRLGR